MTGESADVRSRSKTRQAAVRDRVDDVLPEQLLSRIHSGRDVLRREKVGVDLGQSSCCE